MCPRLVEHAGDLLVDLRSRVKLGTLVLLADGEEIARRELRSPTRGVKRLLQGAIGRAAEQHEARISLPPGSHELVARLIRPDRESVEEGIRIELGARDTHSLRLVLGRALGKPVQWKAANASEEPGSE